ncbi:hypothetical protein pb186bvf_003604 [Paramecium bursaria]
MSKILLALLIASAFSQVEDETQTNDEAQSDYSDSERQLQQQLQQSCFVLTKYQLKDEGEKLQSTIMAYPREEQQKVYQKIQAQYVLQCLSRITQQQVVELYSQFQSQSFKFEDFSDIFMMMDLSAFTNPNESIILNQQEQQITQLVEQFDKEMQKAQKSRQDQEVDDDEEIDPRLRQRQQQNNYKLFGLDFATMSSQTQAYILLGFVGVLSVASYFAYKAVVKNTVVIKPSKKSKKQKN